MYKGEDTSDKDCITLSSNMGDQKSDILPPKYRMCVDGVPYLGRHPIKYISLWEGGGLLLGFMSMIGICRQSTIPSNSEIFLTD